MSNDKRKVKGEGDVALPPSLSDSPPNESPLGPRSCPCSPHRYSSISWPVFLLLGIEQVRINPPGGNPLLAANFTSYPWSHSLVMSLVWGALFSGTYYAVTRYGRGAWVMALGVVSHWVLDYVTHVPDLPIAPGVGTVVGLGL